MILFIILALLLVWIDIKWYEWTGKHISIIFPILLLTLVLPSWIIFPAIILYIIKKVIEWKH